MVYGGYFQWNISTTTLPPIHIHTQSSRKRAERYFLGEKESCCRGSWSAKFPWRKPSFVLVFMLPKERETHHNMPAQTFISLFSFSSGQKLLQSHLVVVFSFFYYVCDVGKVLCVSHWNGDLLTDGYWWCHSSVGSVNSRQLFPWVLIIKRYHIFTFLLLSLPCFSSFRFCRDEDWRIITEMKIQSWKTLYREYIYMRYSLRATIIIKGFRWRQRLDWKAFFGSISESSCTCTTWCWHWFHSQWNPLKNVETLKTRSPSKEKLWNYEGRKKNVSFL